MNTLVSTKHHIECYILNQPPNNPVSGKKFNFTIVFFPHYINKPRQRVTNSWYNLCCGNRKKTTLYSVIVLLDYDEDIHFPKRLLLPQKFCEPSSSPSHFICFIYLTLCLWVRVQLLIHGRHWTHHIDQYGLKPVESFLINVSPILTVLVALENAHQNQETDERVCFGLEFQGTLAHRGEEVRVVWIWSRYSSWLHR